MAQMVKNLPVMQETWVRSLGQEDPLEKEMATHSSILAWRFLAQRNVAGCSPWITKSDMTERLTLSHFKGPIVFNGHEVPLHSCVLLHHTPVSSMCLTLLTICSA